MHFLTISCGQAFNEQRSVIRSQVVKQFSEQKHELVFQKVEENHFELSFCPESICKLVTCFH